MAELNVVGVGVATLNPDLKYVGTKNTAVCTVNLAFNRSYRIEGSSDWQKEVCFIRAQAWGGKAEKLNELVTTGQPIYVNGYLKQDTWETEGQKKTSYSLVIRDFQLCQRADVKNQSQPQPNPSPQPEPSMSDNNQDDLPF